MPLSLGMQQNQHIGKRDRLLALLKGHAPDWVPLGQILAVGGSQYGARIHELRGLGHRIENKPGGSWFRLVTHSTSQAANSTPAVDQRPPDPPAEPESLFGELSPGRTYSE